MTFPRSMFTVLPLVALLPAILSACDRSDPPSEQVERAAGELVAEVENVALPPAGPFAPRDDCSSQPDAPEFLASLRRVVEERNTEALVALADPDVRLGFGGVDGAANMRAEFDAPDGAMWEELAELISMGCAIDDYGNMVMPWYFAQETEGDPFAAMIVTGEDIALRESADPGSPVLARISWDVVALAPVPNGDGGSDFGRADANGWVKVQAGEGEPVTGYMRETDLRSLIDFRMIAERGTNGWRITALLAGD